MKRAYENKPDMTFESQCTMNCDDGVDHRYVSFPCLGADGTSETTNQKSKQGIVTNGDSTKHQCTTVDIEKMGIQNNHNILDSDVKDKTDPVEPSNLRGEHGERVSSGIHGTCSAQDRKECVVEGENIDISSYANCQPIERDRIKGQEEQPVAIQDRNGNRNSQGAPVASLTPHEASPPDGGWGWVVCATCLWVNGTVMGTVNSFGILYDHMYKLYAHGDEEVSLKTSFVGACTNGVMFLMSCVSGILCDVIGLRQTALLGGFLCVLGFLSSAFVSQLELLYLTYGVLLGSGFGLVFSPMVAITGHYFKKKLGMVNGIVTFGASAFTVAMSFALPYLLNYFGLKATLLGYAGLGVILTLCTLSWRPLVSREYANESKDRGETSAVKHCLSFVTRKLFNGRVWKNKEFLCWSLAMSISRFGYLEPYFHMVSHVKHVLPGSNASILITIMAAVSGVSKLIVGKLSDLIRQYRVYLQQGALLAYGVIVICIPFSTTFPGYVVIAVFLGFADAIIMALYGPNAIELVGPGNAAQAIGFASLLGIPTFLSAPSITGAMHDHFKTYNLGFHVTGAITLLSSFLMCVVANPFHNKIPSKTPVSGQPSDNPSPVGDDNGYNIPIDQNDNANTDRPAYINNAYETNELFKNHKIETRL